MEIRTERLLLRRFRESDRDPFAALKTDRRGMEHFHALLDRAASDDFVDRIEACFASRGYSLWAVEVVGGPAFIGFVGLWNATFEAPCTPTVEVGWRLAASAWGGDTPRRPAPHPWTTASCGVALRRWSRSRPRPITPHGR